jgi:hypothetical protein
VNVPIKVVIEDVEVRRTCVGGSVWLVDVVGADMMVLGRKSEEGSNSLSLSCCCGGREVSSVEEEEEENEADLTEGISSSDLLTSSFFLSLNVFFLA